MGTGRGGRDSWTFSLTPVRAACTPHHPAPVSWVDGGGGGGGVHGGGDCRGDCPGPVQDEAVLDQSSRW